MANAKGDNQQQAPGVQSARGPRGPVVSAGANPTIRQRELGIRLRELRNSVGLTVEEVDIAGCGESHGAEHVRKAVQGNVA